MALRLSEVSRIYLGVYNLIQFLGFSSITFYLVHALAFDVNKGTLSSSQIYSTISRRFIIFQAAQLVEIVHVLIGLTRGSPLISFLQIAGRNAILHVCIHSFTSQHGQWFVPWLLLAWSSIECFRYPFYLTSTLGIKLRLITFLRYTAWYPLYPAGILLEALTIRSSLDLLETRGHYSVSLPNPANISFHLPSALKLYLYLLIWPISYTLLTHMHKQSRKALSS